MANNFRGRVAVESRLFSDYRMTLLQEAMIEARPTPFRLARVTALGTLLALWAESQAAQKFEATLEEIEQWTFDGAAAFLERAKFISKTESGDFLIHGNKEQLEGMEQWIEKKRKAGAAGNAKRWSKK